MLTDEQVELLEGPVAVAFGSAAPDGTPDCIRAYALSVSDDRTHVVALFPALPAERLIENVRAQPRVAFTATRPSDFASLQIKGRAVEVRAADARDQQRAAHFKRAFVATCLASGYPDPSVLDMHAAVAIRVHVDRVFRQTPGPGAGDPMGASR